MVTGMAIGMVIGTEPGDILIWAIAGIVLITGIIFTTGTDIHIITNQMTSITIILITVRDLLMDIGAVI